MKLDLVDAMFMPWMLQRGLDSMFDEPTVEREPQPKRINRASVPQPKKVR